MVNIIGRRYWYFALSTLFILPGLVALIAWGLPLGIDFTGGSLLEIRFEQSERPLEAGIVRQAYAAQGLEDSIVQIAEGNVVVARSRELSETGQAAIVAELEAAFGSGTVLTAATVGPSVGAEVAQRAALAVGLATIGILGYITYAFRRVDHAFRYGVAAIIALVHDVLVVLGLAAFFGRFLGWQVDALFLTALLTVVGFSVHDSIVVFDRIRENLIIYRRLDYEAVVNHSVIQTLDRSLNTTLVVLFALLALALYGGDTIRQFVVILLLGVLSGTYSSIFNAAALLVVWENKEWQTWFRRGPRAGPRVNG
jgi:preprotein translocase subunit SecF